MEAQGLSEGSLRNSHRETHAVRRKPAPASFQELARKLVESCSPDLILRQRLDPQKVEGGMKRGTFFVMENDGRADPGFLVFLPGKPAIFLQTRRGRDGKTVMHGSTLRLRASTAVGEGGGSVLIATLDDVTHRLRLEDVWMWRGEALATTQTFSRRREKLKEFVERHWVPDARLLGGIFTTVAQPVSMEAFSKKADFTGVSSVEFIPEAPARRRLVVYMEAIVRAATGPAGMKQLRDGVTPAAQPHPPSSSAEKEDVEVPDEAPPAPVAMRKARAMAVDKMPDVYDLYEENGLPISRASVQQFSISQRLRKALEGAPAGVWVLARWRAEFGGYEIVGLVADSDRPNSRM
jgi:hypothetical protein